MKSFEGIFIAVGAVCAGLALATATGCPVLPTGEPEAGRLLHPLVLLCGLAFGFLSRRRSLGIERNLWRVVDDAALTSGEREYAHHEAAAEKKRVAVAHLAAPIGLGLLLAYQFKGEEFSVADLLTISPLIGFVAGLWLGGLRQPPTVPPHLDGSG